MNIFKLNQIQLLNFKIITNYGIYENDLFQQNNKDLKISKHPSKERVTITPILYNCFSKLKSWIGDQMNDEPI